MCVCVNKRVSAYTTAGKVSLFIKLFVNTSHHSPYCTTLLSSLIRSLLISTTLNVSGSLSQVTMLKCLINSVSIFVISLILCYVLLFHTICILLLSTHTHHTQLGRKRSPRRKKKKWMNWITSRNTFRLFILYIHSKMAYK